MNYNLPPTPPPPPPCHKKKNILYRPVILIQRSRLLTKSLRTLEDRFAYMYIIV